MSFWRAPGALTFNIDATLLLNVLPVAEGANPEVEDSVSVTVATKFKLVG